MKLIRTFLAWILILAVAGAAGLWWFGPDLVAPREDFDQGPGGAVAYITLSNQLRGQTQQFLGGKDVKIIVNQEEFSGMLASALLSGRGQENPVRKVRAYLPEGQLQVDTILELPYAQVPERYRNRPIGLTLDLQPVVSAEGEVQFRITHAKVGMIPVPVSLIKWAGQRLPLKVSNFDLKEATIELPISDLIAGSFGRNLTIKQFDSSKGQLTLVVAMTRKP